MRQNDDDSKLTISLAISLSSILLQAKLDGTTMLHYPPIRFSPYTSVLRSDNVQTSKSCYFEFRVHVSGR